MRSYSGIGLRQPYVDRRIMTAKKKRKRSKPEEKYTPWTTGKLARCTPEQLAKRLWWLGHYSHRIGQEIEFINHLVNKREEG